MSNGRDTEICYRWQWCLLLVYYHLQSVAEIAVAGDDFEEFVTQLGKTYREQVERGILTTGLDMG